MSNPFAPHILDEDETAIAARRVRAANPWVTVRVARSADVFDRDVYREDGQIVLPVAVLEGPRVEMTWLGGIRGGTGQPVVTEQGDVLATAGAAA